MLPPGALVTGRYRIIRPIGSGGFGSVYEAEHVVTQRRVAVKTLWPHFASDPGARARFLCEARLAAQVDSEFIVDVLDAGLDEASDAPFLVMELLEGEHLGARLRRKKRFSSEECIVYLSQVAAALERTHARAIVHCDLKPANLFLTTRRDGQPLVKILDFGIARLLEGGATEASQALGTPLYMAPEQFMQDAMTPAVDVFALAQNAFRFLVGETYYRIEHKSCDGAWSLALALADGPSEKASVRARRYGGAVPPRFDAWFACAAHAKPSQRFQSAKQAVLALAWSLGLPPPVALARAPSRRAIGALTVSDGPPTERRPSEASSPSPAALETSLAPTLDVTRASTRPSVRQAARESHVRRFALVGIACVIAWFGALGLGTYGWRRLRAVNDAPFVFADPLAALRSTRAAPAKSQAAEAQPPAQRRGD